MSTFKKTAIVTGASSGIGKYISIKLAQNNFDVILIARNKQKLQSLKKIINNEGNDCSVVALDISDKISFNKINSKLGKINNIEVLINNAGIGVFNKLENISIDEWNQQINTNLSGAFLMTKMVVGNMKKNNSGKIVFINSVGGINSYPYSSAYVASKFGLRGFASSIREELREHNIKVISIHPGAINTPFWDNSKIDFPRNEMLSSEDVADSIINVILAKNNVVHEEVIIRRTAGDF